MVFLNLPTRTLFRFAGLGLVPVSGGLSGAGCGQAAVGNNDGNYGDDDDDDDDYYYFNSLKERIRVGYTKSLFNSIYSIEFYLLYYYMRNFCNLIGLEQWYFSVI